MRKINLAIFTAGRSDFGLLKNIIYKINKDRRFNLHLLIGSAHFSKIFGETFQEIQFKSIKNKYKLKYNYSGSSNKEIIKYFNLTIARSFQIMKSKNIDCSLVLGDRYEALGFAFSCLNLNIPILHIGGGSTTGGSLDEIHRYCISKMSFAHFVETNLHKKKLKELGFKKNIFVIGAPSLENYKKDLMSKKKFETSLNFKFDTNKKILICNFHPETNISKAKNIKNLNFFIKFLNSKNENIIFTYPNADEGFSLYINIIKKKIDKKKSFLLVKNLGRKRYLSALNFSDLLIGNSSSGIIESCSFKLPTINLGLRQLGRFSNRNVLHSSFDPKEINKNYNISISKKFRKKIKKLHNIYAINNTSKKFINTSYKLIRDIINK